MTTATRLGLSAAFALALTTAAAAQIVPSSVSFRPAAAPETGAIAVAVQDGGLTGAAAEADRISQGAVSRALAAADFKAKPGDVLSLFGVGPYTRVIAVGVGAGATTETDLEDFGGRVAIAAASGQPGPIAVFTPDAPAVQFDSAIAARGALFGGYAYGEAFDRARPNPARTLSFAAADPAAENAVFQRDGVALAEGVAFARNLISEPSNIKSPQWFVDQTRAATRNMRNVTIEVLDERQMERMGMGLIVGVGQGSTRPPRLLAVRYNGAARSEAPIAFVGKGITFDAGGISLKEPEGMWRMRYDMSGAAASVATVLTLAKRGAKVNAVGVAALAENMPDGNAIRPGDVLKSYSGKTVEVLNTDAEGRLVVADALAWVQDKHKPRAVITIGTLTGAVRTALGDDYAGLFANDERFAAQIQAAAEASDEPVWRLPLHPSVYRDLRSDVADVKNVVEGTGNPGSSIAAAFVGEWVNPGMTWGHLDIASVAWKTSRTPTVPVGAVGFGVRLLDRLVKDNFEQQ